MKKNINIIIILFIFSGCTASQEIKVLSMNETNTCISEIKSECNEIIKDKCGKNVKIFREELVEYIFSSDKYIMTFKCE